jgi:ADP-heptose:LPS heptosyltransferase
MTSAQRPITSLLVYSQGEVIGDGILKLPFLAALRREWPRARIAWATAGPTVYASLLKPAAEQLGIEVIANLEPQLGWRALLEAPLAGESFDIVIDTQAQVARTLALRRIRHGRFFSAALGYRLGDGRPRAPAPEAILGRLMVLAGLAAGRALAPAPPPPAPGRWAEAAAALLPTSPAYVGLAPGAGGKNKCWPLERYTELARRLSSKNLTPVIFLGPEENDWVAPLKAALPQALFPEWGRRDAFADLKGPYLAIALCARLKAGVANNAAPAQMMAAGGASVLALHERRRSAAKFRPFGDRVETIAAEDFGEGMGAIPIEAVEAALARLMACGSTSSP